MTTERTRIDGEHAFDLNIGEVLEHWTVPFAIRELIANALDEQLLTNTAEPTITKDSYGRWHITDFGRGVRYEHLAQNENAEKLLHAQVIGQFGMGLKDALAVFDRRGVQIEIRSPHGDMVTARRPKDRFADVVTLHALVRPATDPHQVGTEVILAGISDDDMGEAKSFFLRYSAERLLETTRYGQVLERPLGQPAGRIYVKGLLVAEEENFLFSYNITNLNKPLQRALNRERSNVGRAAYSDRIKTILQQCEAAEVAGPLAQDLSEYITGKMHDELQWRDVAEHACRVLATHEKVVFVTPWELAQGSPQLDYARQEGYRLVTVTDDISDRLDDAIDLDGRPVLNFGGYRDAWNESFAFTFVDPVDLDRHERAIFELTSKILNLVPIPRGSISPTVSISETMRIDESGHSVVGLWQSEDQRIIIKRSQLGRAADYCGTLLHELTHATSDHTDGTLEFEHALTELLGAIGLRAIDCSANAGQPRQRWA